MCGRDRGIFVNDYVPTCYVLPILRVVGKTLRCQLRAPDARKRGVHGPLPLDQTSDHLSLAKVASARVWGYLKVTRHQGPTFLFQACDDLHLSTAQVPRFEDTASRAHLDACCIGADVFFK